MEKKVEKRGRRTQALNEKIQAIPKWRQEWEKRLLYIRLGDKALITAVKKLMTHSKYRPDSFSHNAAEICEKGGKLSVRQREALAMHLAKHIDELELGGVGDEG